VTLGQLKKQIALQ